VKKLDPLVNALNSIMNHEERRKTECIIAPASRLISQVLRLFQYKGYVGEIEFIDDGRQGKLRVQLFGRINECRAITPRFKTKVSELEKWEKRFLPSRNLGAVILSTSEGILDNLQAKEQNVGGILLAYVY
jgi:small subunit ribosomal protein S8